MQCLCCVFVDDLAQEEDDNVNVNLEQWHVAVFCKQMDQVLENEVAELSELLIPRVEDLHGLYATME